MKRILLLFSAFLLLFLIACSNEDNNVTGASVAFDIIQEEDAIEEISEKIEEVPEEIHTVRLCHDTDNSINRFVAGKTFGYYDNSSRFEFEDFCTSLKYVREFYCEDENPMQGNFECEYGCEEGHCR